MRYLERQILLQIIDNRWREHLYEMDYLREGIHLRGFAQIDPLVAYKNEGFTMFHELMNSIWEEFARVIFHVEVKSSRPGGGDVRPAEQPSQVPYSGGAAAAARRRSARPPARQRPSAMRDRAGRQRRAARRAAAPRRPPGRQPAGRHRTRRRSSRPTHEKIGRNDPCWCGSGKKYKKCHGA